jgi:thiamine biosynthesis protein ThiI
MIPSMASRPAPPCDRLLVHYAEIGTKGGNRPMFEATLGRNLDGALRGFLAGWFGRESGRLTARLGPGADAGAASARAAMLPGVAWCAPVRTVPSDLDAIREAVLALALSHDEGPFRIEARRTDKAFPLDSPAINAALGAAVVEATGRPVSLGAPRHTYGVEVDRRRSYVFGDRHEGPGGLPVGCEGELVALVSGGLDSPVAAWRMMVRGCRIHLVHFLNRSVATNRVVDKIEALAARLSVFHGPLPLTFIPFDEAQREIVMVVPSEIRMIVYRRMMLRIAELLRAERRAMGFVTGDSVGQVASQTLENLAVINAVARWPVFAPLCGLNKSEITGMARRIGTYETSILPHEDCCSFLVARHPETRAELAAVEAMERFDAATLAARLFAGREERLFDSGQQPVARELPPA